MGEQERGEGVTGVGEGEQGRGERGGIGKKGEHFEWK